MIDILNEALLSSAQGNKYYLINRERSFTLIPADEKIDMVLLPRINPEDMSKHGDTELVSMVLLAARRHYSSLDDVRRRRSRSRWDRSAKRFH